MIKKESTGAKEITGSRWIEQDDPFCLCVGSGITRYFVGTWPELLNQLLCARMINRWLDSPEEKRADGKPVPAHKAEAIRELIANMNQFSFFEGEGNLEQGDYLLSDDRKPGALLNFSDEQIWQEKYFSEQVSLQVRKKVGDYCKDPLHGKRSQCECKSCKDTCPIFSGTHEKQPSGIYMGLKKANEKRPFKTREERESLYRECTLYHDLSTLMAVVELCLAGKIKYIINYNFDLIIEQILANDAVLRSKGRTESTPLHIHIWTYGNSTVRTKERKADEDHSLYRLHIHLGEEWSFKLKPGEDEDGHAIHFFHVHGIGGVPEEWKNQYEELKDTRPIVFSEHSYMEYQRAVFNWSNRTMINLLHRFPILTVGFSGEDANFRSVLRAIKNSDLSRILSDHSTDNAGEESRIILLRAKNEHEKKFRESLKNAAPKDPSHNEELVKFFSGIYEKMVANYYRNYFDITVRWEKDFDSIAGFLMERY